MASREDLGRLAHAAYCDMAGEPGSSWASLQPREQAGWTHVATTVRDRLALGISHAYRPEDDEPDTPTPPAPPERRRRAPAAQATPEQ